jgi:hypothetical protein
VEPRHCQATPALLYLGDSRSDEILCEEDLCRALRGYCRSSSGPAERPLHHGRSSPKFRLPDPCPLACPSHAICLLAMRNERARRQRLKRPCTDDTQLRTPITTHLLWLTPRLFTAIGMLFSSRTCPWRHYTTPVANRNLHEEECLALVDKQVIGTTGNTSILTQSHHTALLRPEALRNTIYSALA